MVKTGSTGHSHEGFAVVSEQFYTKTAFSEKSGLIDPPDGVRNCSQRGAWRHAGCTPWDHPSGVYLPGYWCAHTRTTRVTVHGTCRGTPHPCHHCHHGDYGATTCKPRVNHVCLGLGGRFRVSEVDFGSRRSISGLGCVFPNISQKSAIFSKMAIKSTQNAPLACPYCPFWPF